MELFLVLVVTVIAAVIGGIVWPVFGSRIQRPTCYMLRSSDPDQLIHRVLDFYVDRIDYDERIPPSFLRFYLESPDYTVTSINELSHRCAVSDKPIHVFLFVKHGDRIVGVCKLIYVCALGSFFIAYYTARPDGEVSSTDILTTMIDYITPAIDEKHNLYYEICKDREGGTSHVAKERLFRHYAQSRGFVARTLKSDYLQPEISAFEGAFEEPLPAELYVLARTQEMAQRYNPAEVVTAIFDSVYLDCFVNVDPTNKQKYTDYLRSVQRLMGLETCQEATA